MKTDIHQENTEVGFSLVTSFLKKGLNFRKCQDSREAGSQYSSHPIPWKFLKATMSLTYQEDQGKGVGIRKKKEKIKECCVEREN